MKRLKWEVEIFSGVGGILRHRGAFPCVQVGFWGACWDALGGSGGDGERRGLEDDVSIHDCVGERVEVGEGVQVTLVGDVSSVVLKDREGSFGYGACFVGVFEVG